MVKNNCTDFIDMFFLEAYVPNGGGASALVGAIGMTFGSMVGNLSLGKKKYVEVEEDIKVLRQRAQEITFRLKEMVKADAETFRSLSDAYLMPFGTEEEKKEKDAAMQSLLEASSKILLQIVECCLEALDLLDEHAEKDSGLAVCEVGVGALFCRAAMQGAGLNVLLNTGIMTDKKLKSRFENRLNKIETSGISKMEIIYSKVRRQMQMQKRQIEDI